MKFQFKFFTIVILFSTLLSSCTKDDDSNGPTFITTYDFEKTIAEMPSMGFEIGTLLASTNRGSLSYSLIGQSIEGAMAVDAASGKLTVTDPSVFVHAVNPMITATAQVTNQGISEEIHITITIEKIESLKIYQGSINLRNQEEVDAFGAENYTHITGTLNIGKYIDLERSDIHDLSSLSSIQYVGLNLIVGLCPDLQTLDGLDNITQVARQLVIVQNEKLIAITSLQQVQGQYLSLSIMENGALENLDGLESLKTLASINISENPSLKNIQGLTGVEQSGEVRIYGNPQLTELTGLDNIEYVNLGLYIQHNAMLMNLDALSNLKSIENELIISDNASLMHIDGLNNVENWSRSIVILNNAVLENINALSPIQDASSISINDNPSLENLDGLSNLKSVNTLSLNNNKLLTHVNPLRNLKVVGTMTINNNQNLSDISGLSSLESVAVNLNLKGNDALSNLEGLNQLRIIGRDLSIQSNSALTDFCALQPELIAEGLIGGYNVRDNAFNPTKNDLIDGNCSL